MSSETSIWILLVLALIMANIPWFSERTFLVWDKPDKGYGMRLLEWLVFYFLLGLIALGLEQKTYGERHQQEWEFYAVTLCLFVVFALPGFIYRVEKRKH